MGGEYDILLFGVTGFTGGLPQVLELLRRASEPAGICCFV
jgi:hypothetical protein